MTRDTIKNWESDLVDCPSASVPAKVAIVRGGESITLKSEAATDAYHLVGMRHILEAGRGYKLWGGETMTIDLKAAFGMNNILEILALPSTAGDDITWFKAKGSNAEGLAEIERIKGYLSEA